MKAPAAKKKPARSPQRRPRTTAASETAALLGTLGAVTEGLVLGWNQAGKLTFWSAGMEMLTGCKAETVLGQPLGELPFFSEEATDIGLTTLETGEFRRQFPGLPLVRNFRWQKFPLAGTTGKPKDGGLLQLFPQSEESEETRVFRERERLLRFITDAPPALLSYIDAQRHYRFVNRQYEQWFGRSRHEFEGRHIQAVIGEAFYERIRDKIDAALGGQSVEFANWVTYPGREPRYIQATYVPDWSESGVVRGFVSLSADLTRQKLVEDKLRFLLDACAALSSSLDYEVTLRNVAWLAVPRMADWCFVDMVSETELVKNLVAVHQDPARINFYHDLMRQYPHREDDPTMRVIREGKPFLLKEPGADFLRSLAYDERHFQLMSGQPLTALMILPLVCQGKTLGALTLIATESQRHYTEEDLELGEQLARQAAIAIENAELYRQLTEEHQRAQANEAYFRNLAEAIPHMVWTCDVNGRFEFCNKRWEQFAGRSPEQTQGRRWLETVHPDHSRRVEEAWRSSRQTGQPYEVEYPLRGADGTYRWHLDRALPLRGMDGSIVKWFGTCTDIHEKKLTTGIFREMNKELERRVTERTNALREINDQMESFCYSVSHDLRAPLRTLRSFTQVLNEDYGGKLEQGAQDILVRLSKAAERMDNLIQDLLQYSRVSRMEMVLETTDLEKLLDDILVDLRLELQNRQAVLEVVRPLPRVTAAGAILNQVLVNLVSNALKFVPMDRKPTVKIWTETEGTRLKFFIRDNGIGIQPEHHQRIFRVFERLHGVDVYPGTGIGLAIVQKGMERMNGRVGLESTLGEGSCFWLELPLAEG